MLHTLLRFLFQGFLLHHALFSWAPSRVDGACSPTLFFRLESENNVGSKFVATERDGFGGRWGGTRDYGTGQLESGSNTRK